MFTLISATPSPYARKIRIALLEKSLSFTLQTEVPWDSTTTVPTYNPLEKLPVLIFNEPTTATTTNNSHDSSRDDQNNNEDFHAIYESHFILEFLETKFPSPPLLPPVDRVNDRLRAKQIEVVADGMCDALVLAIFEKKRETPSQPWLDRQMRKVDGGLGALAKWLGASSNKTYLVGDALTIADIAVASVLGFMTVRWPEHPWQKRYPELKSYWEKLDQRPSFESTKPFAQTIKDKIV